MYLYSSKETCILQKKHEKVFDSGKYKTDDPDQIWL